MDSLLQLFYISLYLYLGFFTHIAYTIVFFYQKRFIFLKILFFFSFIAYIWIKITNKYNVSFHFILGIIYGIGIILSYLLFEKKLNKLNSKYIIYLHKMKDRIWYLIKIGITPSFFYTIHCYIYKKIYYRKHPWLKPIGIKKLF